MDKKAQVIEALRAFIAQRSGIEWANYGGSREALMGDYRPMLRDGRTARAMLAIVEASGIEAEEIMEAARQAFSGRLSILERGDGSITIGYCTGQYFPTEYRKAACAVLGLAISRHYRKDYPDGIEGGEAWRKHAQRSFGRSIAKWL